MVSPYFYQLLSILLIAVHEIRWYTRFLVICRHLSGLYAWMSVITNPIGQVHFQDWGI